ncbi:hypothetical protein ACOSQ3_026406 [Xanthoceras sorbifolium]
MPMIIMKTPHVFSTILWLSLLYLLFFFFFFQGFWCSLLVSNNSIHREIPVLHDRHHHSRKLLAGKFDFTPFLPHRHHRHHHRTHVPQRPEPTTGKEIDPRYGVEKRLVPTGPNPLHH